MNGTNTDYFYDVNGRLSKDNNKGIFNVSYNYLHKPTIVMMTPSSNRIAYSYDATGNKVQERSTVNGVVKVTDYIGNFVYEDNVAKYAITGEGRTTFDITTAQPIKEEFFVKDHLDNVRSVVDVYNWPIAQYLATYELASANLEGLFFGDMEDVRDIKPGSTDPNDNRAGNLNGADPNRRVGTSMLLKVMAGDKIEMNVNNFYDGYNTGDDQPAAMEDMLSSVIGTLTGGEGGFTGSETHNAKLVSDVFGMPNYQAFDQLVNQNTDAQKPKAYLNYVLFDETMKLLPEMSGAFQANGNVGWSQIGTTAPMTIPANGYLAVYLSNRSVLSCGTCGNVYFDQLMVRMTTGKLKEEAHYYPYGLPISTMGSAAAGFIPNRNKYQNNEYNKELGLNWMDFHNRQYDPQIGRFLSIDPMAESTANLSPYTGMNNNPVTIMDPLGLQGEVNPSYNSQTPAVSFVRPLGWWHYQNPNGEKTMAGAMTEAAMQNASDMQLLYKVLQSMGTGATAQGSSGVVNNSGSTRNGTVTSDGGMVGTYEDYVNKEISQSDRLMTTNLHTGYGGPGDAASTAFWNQYDEFFLNITPLLNILNAGSETFTGKNLVGVEFQAPSAFEASSPVGRVGKASKILTVEEQAAELSAKVGKNSVTIGTTTKQIRYDLVGRAHAGVPTPHVQIYTKNFYEGTVRSITRASKEAIPITQQEIRIIRNYLKSIK
jgi:RHS repeat-associated protein